jgi:hypothetical protein
MEEIVVYLVVTQALKDLKFSASSSPIPFA